MAIDLYELALRYKSEGFQAVSKDMDTLEKKGKGISKSFGALKASIIGGLVGGLLTKIAVESIEAQKQTAQLNAVLKSTSGIAGVTATEIDNIAEALQRTTTFSDDAVKGAASLLLTFTNIRGEVFKNTLPAILDLSEAMGQDLQSSAVQVGKALNDPIKGMTALQRVGVTFSASQKEVIKHLVETNRLSEAQGIILKELETEFGGSAKAARDTLGGALKGLENSWGDLFEVSTDSSRGIVGAINRLSEALDKNKEKWHQWAANLLDPDGGPLHFLNVLSGWIDKYGRFINQLPFLGSGEGTGGGGGGGRDTPTGPLRLPGVTVMGTPPAGGGGGGGGGKEKKIDIPNIDINWSSVEQDKLDKLGQPPEDWAPAQLPTDWLEKVFDDFHKAQDRYGESLREFEQNIKEQTNDAAKRIGDVITGGFSQTLGDAIYNAFSAAFDGKGIGGILKAFGKTMLAGIGQMFTQLGMVYLEYGGLMKGLAAFLPNPFTAGWAGVAIGAALIAMGAALGAVGHGSARGTAQAGAFREPVRATEDITRFKFIDRNGNLVNSLTPVQPIHFTVIGEHDPVAQRQISNIVKNANRRDG